MVNKIDTYVTPIPGFLRAIMQMLKNIALPRVQSRLWIRQVDDIFVIIKRSEIERHKQQNRRRIQIHHGKGKETNFLDVVIRRPGNETPKTSVYREQVNTDQKVSFQNNRLKITKRFVWNLFQKDPKQTAAQWNWGSMISSFSRCSIERDNRKSHKNCARKAKENESKGAIRPENKSSVFRTYPKWPQDCSNHQASQMLINPQKLREESWQTSKVQLKRDDRRNVIY